jgi:hypothetical protein
MFSTFVGNNKSPAGFLEWWNDHPIILGGDRYSALPGLAVYYIQHSNSETFELKVEPVQQDQLTFTQDFLDKVLGNDSNKHCIQLKIKHEQYELATALLYVDDQRRWAAGEGQWQALRGLPRHWDLECLVL